MKPGSIAVLVSVLSLVLSTGLAIAQEVPAAAVTDALTSFRQYKDVTNVELTVPAVVEIPFNDTYLERNTFAVLNQVTQAFEPYLFVHRHAVAPAPLTISSTVPGSHKNMIDDDTKTFTEFALLPDEDVGAAVITLTSATPITSSAITTLLPSHVALPRTVQLTALVGGTETVVVAPRDLRQTTIRFPETTSTKWTISFTYSQPLRISELQLRQTGAKTSTTQAIRFLAQPGTTYRIYFDADRVVSTRVSEAGNLRADEDIVVVPSVAPQTNPVYQIADGDGDGVPDVIDNCVATSNADQADVNGNGRGDVCDDFDRDGLVNEKDNCPNHPNARQADEDGDGIGDACDGEESRLTERHAWIPWVGIGFAFVVVIGLFGLTVQSMRKEKREDAQQPPSDSSSSESQMDTTTPTPPTQPDNTGPPSL